VVSPGNAPPGCSFCRPQFAAAAAAAAAGLGQDGSSASSVAPLLQLGGLWHPLLGVQTRGSVVPNDVLLGGHRPGAMLLTGEACESRDCDQSIASLAGGECTIWARPYFNDLLPLPCSIVVHAPSCVIV
jgi:hypothetical protein